MKSSTLVRMLLLPGDPELMMRFLRDPTSKNARRLSIMQLKIAREPRGLSGQAKINALTAAEMRRREGPRGVTATRIALVVALVALSASLFR